MRLLQHFLLKYTLTYLYTNHLNPILALTYPKRLYSNSHNHSHTHTTSNNSSGRRHSDAHGAPYATSKTNQLAPISSAIETRPTNALMTRAAFHKRHYGRTSEPQSPVIKCRHFRFVRSPDRQSTTGRVLFITRGGHTTVARSRVLRDDADLSRSQLWKCILGPSFWTQLIGRGAQSSRQQEIRTRYRKLLGSCLSPFAFQEINLKPKSELLGLINRGN